MASTSAEVLARLGALGWPETVDLLAELPPSELFGQVVEPLSDSFDPKLVPVYVDLFTRLLSRTPGLPKASALSERFEQLRMPRELPEPERVVVLSRITLGADVAITSTFLAAALARWPGVPVVFAGPAKNFALFAGDSRIQLLETPYGRGGTLAERLGTGLSLAPQVAEAGTVVLDPDSRLSQLGLLPLATLERTLFFDSRSIGGPEDSLVNLAKAFVRERLGVKVGPWVLPQEGPGPEPADVAVSFGVGENPAKRISDVFERELIAGLLGRGYRVLLDSGAPGTDESERALRLAEEFQAGLQLWSGPFAPFAAAVGRSRLYVGYDSAGQHVAAAYGVPRITVFHGYPGDRFLARWRPDGMGVSKIVRGGPAVTANVLFEAGKLLN